MKVSALLELTIGTLRRGREASREIESLVSNAFEQGTIDALNSVARDPAATKAIKKLNEVGMTGAAKTLEKTYANSARSQMKSTRAIEALNQKIARTQDTSLKKRLQKEKKHHEGLVDSELRSQKKVLAQADSAAKNRARLMEEAEERRHRTGREKASEIGDILGSGVDQAFSADNLDLAGITKTLTSGLSGGLDKAVGSLSASGVGASGGGGAALLTSLTAVAASLAAVSAVFVAFAAVASAAYGQSKEMNKSLIEGAGAFDLVGREGKTFSESLGDIRKVSVGLAYDLRTSKEEVLSAITAFNDAGVTMREFQGIARNLGGDIEALENVTRAAILASTALGISVQDSAGFFNAMNRDLGYGLTEIQGAFGMIAKEAERAGMTTKDFFAAINGATSGMALYNFRIGDTLGLLTDMTKILGEDLAKEKLGMEGTFRGMGMQERMKSVMLSGGKAGKVVKADAKAQAEEFAKKLGGRVQGLDAVGGAGSIDVKALGSMNEEEFNNLYRGITASNQQDEDSAKRMIASLRDLSKVYQGGTMATAQALGGLSKTGELAMELSQGFGLIGKPISEATAMDEMILQEALGLSAEQIDVNKRLDRALRDEFSQLQAAGKHQEKTFEEALADGTLSQTQAMKYGADLQSSVTERMGLQALRESRSIKDVLTNKIAQTLEGIYSILEGMYKFFGADNSEEKRLALEMKSRRRAEDSSEALMDIGRLLGEQERISASTRDVDEKRAAEEEIERLLLQQDLLQKTVEAERVRQSSLQSGATIDQASQAYLETKFGSGARGRGEGKILSEYQQLGIDPYTQDPNVHGPSSYFLKDKEGQEEELERVLEQELRGQSEQTGVLTGGFDDMTTILGDMDRRQEREERSQNIAKLTALMEASGASTEASESALMQAMVGGSPAALQAILAQGEGGTTVEESALAKGLGISGVTASSTQLNDFIYRGNTAGGEIIPVNNQDIVSALPNGPIAGAMGGKSVTVHINGNDLGAMRREMIKILQDTGYGNMRSY
jgi:hypothetical protein